MVTVRQGWARNETLGAELKCGSSHWNDGDTWGYQSAIRRLSLPYMGSLHTTECNK